MCGITIISGDTVSSYDVKQMIKIQKYRGPHVEGYYNDKYASLGHCGLSNVTQAARVEFCERYGYARKDRLDIWADELKHVTHSKRGGCQ